MLRHIVTLQEIRYIVQHERRVGRQTQQEMVRLSTGMRLDTENGKSLLRRVLRGMAKQEVHHARGEEVICMV